MKKMLALICCLMMISIVGCSKEKEEPPAETTTDVWATLEEAYIYALPLVIFDATATQLTNTVEPSSTHAPYNQLMHAANLATSETKSVVTPNVDTIYSQSFLDLSETAMIFQKPAVERYCSVEILDAYTNCVAILGTGGDDVQAAQTYLFAGPGFSGEIPEGVTQVALPTNTAWMLVRTMVENEADLENVYAIQDAMALLPLDVYVSGAEYTPEPGLFDEKNDFVPIEHVTAMSMETFFERANQLMEQNAPAAADSDILARFAEINVGPGLSFDASVFEDSDGQKWQAMVKNIDGTLLEHSKEFMKIFGAWQFFGYPIAEFGSEYAYRALIAKEGLGANPESAAIYPKASTDDSGEILDGNHRYVIHFAADGLPPTKEFGFWSITAYGEDKFLIDNEIDRYLINERSDLSYNEDGSLDIYLQTEPPEDEALLGNWLPVAKAQFHLHMRIYLPESTVTDGSWQYPTIEKVE